MFLKKVFSGCHICINYFSLIQTYDDHLTWNHTKFSALGYPIHVGFLSRMGPQLFWRGAPALSTSYFLMRFLQQENATHVETCSPQESNSLIGDQFCSTSIKTKIWENSILCQHSMRVGQTQGQHKTTKSLEVVPLSDIYRFPPFFNWTVPFSHIDWWKCFGETQNCQLYWHGHDL